MNIETISLYSKLECIKFLANHYGLRGNNRTSLVFEEKFRENIDLLRLECKIQFLYAQGEDIRAELLK